MKKIFQTIWRYFTEILKSFTGDNYLAWSGAISYYAIFSIVPFILILTSLLGFVFNYIGYFLGLSAAQADIQVAGYISKVFPTSTPFIMSTLNSLRDSKEIFGGAGIFFMLIIAGQVFETIEMAVNFIWHSKARPRNFFKRKLFIYVLIVGLSLALFGYFILSTTISVVSGLVIFGVALKDLPFIFHIVKNLMLYGSSILIFSCINKFLPNAAVSWKGAFLGGTFAGVFWEIAKYLFSLYLKNIARYQIVYGALATIVILLTWINYSAVILLLGAKITSIFESNSAKKAYEGYSLSGND